MDWLVWITLLGVGTLEVANLRKLNRMEKEFSVYRVRQGNIKKQLAERRNPQVVHPRTTRRDSSDLPATARMGSLNRKSTQVARQPNDSGLQSES